MRQMSYKLPGISRWISVVISLILISCGHNRDEKCEDGFYSRVSGYDYTRVPLLKPYEMLRLNGLAEWHVNKNDNAADFGLTNVDSINVVNGVIIGHSAKDSYYKGGKINSLWFSIIPKTYTELAFTSRVEFEQYAKQKGIKSIKLVACKRIFEDFENECPVRWEKY